MEAASIVDEIDEARQIGHNVAEAAIRNESTGQARQARKEKGLGRHAGLENRPPLGSLNSSK